MVRGVEVVRGGKSMSQSGEKDAAEHSTRPPHCALLNFWSPLSLVTGHILDQIKYGGDHKRLWLQKVVRGISRNPHLVWPKFWVLWRESLWLQTVMRGISRSPKLLAPPVAQILPRIIRCNTQPAFDSYDHISEDMNWPEPFGSWMCS